jgi:glycosyltransferase involved in cell wall biosynthesis
MMQPLHLAYFVHVLDQVGGAEIATRRWADVLAARGHDVTLIGSQPMSHWLRERRLIERQNGLRIVRFPVWQRSRWLIDTLILAETSAALLSFRRTKLLHVRGFSRDTMRIAVVAKRLGMKVVCTPMASGVYGDVAKLPPSLSPSAAHAHDWVACQTEAMRGEIVNWGYPAERTSVIPNSVDTTFFVPAPTPPPARSAIFVGRFRPEKRIGLLLEAWQIIQPSYPDALLTLVGGGDLQETYQRQAAALGLRVNFFPTLPPSGVIEQLQQHSIFIMSGVSEGMSNALLEAMSTGLTPIVSDTPGNRAVVSPGVNGLTYESESASALADVLRHLFDHPDERQRLGQQARETVLQNFTLASVVNRYESLYHRLLSS